MLLRSRECSVQSITKLFFAIKVQLSYFTQYPMHYEVFPVWLMGINIMFLIFWVSFPPPPFSLGLFLYMHALINMLNIQEGLSVYLWCSHFMQLSYCLVLCSADPWLPWCRYGLLAPSQLKKSGGLSWVFPPNVMAWKFYQLQQLLGSPICFSQRITILCFIFRFFENYCFIIFFQGFCCCY